MKLNLTKIDERIAKLQQWKQALSEIASDSEGAQILREIATSSNGDRNTVHITARPRMYAPIKRTKKAVLDDAITQALPELNATFEAQQLMSHLLSKGMRFSRREPMSELGAALRRLVAGDKIRVARERVGNIGRLYEQVSR